MRLKVVGESSSRFLPLLVAFLTRVGGIPFAEKNLQPLQLQPAFEQVNLRGFARSVEAFDRDQPARKSQFSKSLHDRSPCKVFLPEKKTKRIFRLNSLD